jgi:hypothetical protein
MNQVNRAVRAEAILALIRERSQDSKILVGEICTALGLPWCETSRRRVIEAVAWLRDEEGHPIGSSRGSDPGYWYMRSEQELREALRAYDGQVMSMLRTRRRLKNALRRAEGEKQIQEWAEGTVLEG